jgi:signal transduction histidine kinase
MTLRVFIISAQLPSATLITALQQADFQVHLLTEVDELPHPLTERDVILLNRPDDLSILQNQLHQLRRHPLRQTIPIIAAVNPDQRQAVLDAGADDFVTLPLEAGELIHRLRQQIKNRRILVDIDILEHDLKSPLGTIMPSLDLISQSLGEDYSDLGELAYDALLATRRQTMLIDTMLAFWRIRAGSYVLQLTPIQLGDVVEILRHKIPDSVGRREVQIRYDLPRELPTITADQQLLTQALLALADNAIKFCASNCQIVLRVHMAGQQLHITFADTGRPILPEYRDRLFNLEGQFEIRLAGGRTSVALNLPFARAALRLMGGDVTFSEQDGWNSFTASLPLS